MELFTSVWILVLFYYTDWLGIRHCFAVPVPTLSNNFHHGYYSRNSWDHKQSRNPDAMYEKFVFPSKQQEIMPIYLAERSSLGGGGDSEGSDGKIFFPDELPEQPKENQYEYMDAEVHTGWKSQLRPSAEASSSERTPPNLDPMENSQSSEDGSIRMESPASQQQPENRHPTGSSKPNFKNSLQLTSHDFGTTKKTQEQQVQEAVQEFYKWLVLSNGRPYAQFKGKKKCPEQYENGSGVLAGTSATSGTKSDSVISDQSLVAGLKDKKCPEGQVRLENGECKVKLSI